MDAMNFVEVVLDGDEGRFLWGSDHLFEVEIVVDGVNNLGVVVNGEQGWRSILALD